MIDKRLCSLGVAKICGIILLLLLMFHTVNNYIVLSLDNTFPTYDEFDHLNESFHIHNFFKGLNREEFSLNMIYRWFYNLGNRYRPPLYRLILSLTYVFQNNINVDYITMVNMLYFAVLLISLYGIGTKLQNNLTGILAAFIVSMFPGIFGMSRVLMVDFPLTAMVTLSIYLMLLTKNFTDTKYSLLFGLSIGLGMLTKVPYFIFILPLLVYYIFLSFIKAFKKDRRLVIIGSNLIISLLISLFVIGPWYLPNLYRVIQRAKAMSLQLDNSPFGSFIDYYISVLFSNHIGAFFFIASLISLFFCLRRKKGAFLFIWLLVPLFIFSCSPNKNPRFILPLLPVFGLTIAYSISSIEKDLIRRVAFSFIIIFGLFSYFTISYGKINFFPNVKKYPFYSSFRINHGILSPQQINWKIEEIGNSILSSIQKENYNTSIRILPLFNIGEIHNALKYYFMSKNINVYLECPAQADFFDSPSVNDFPDILTFHFVIKKTNYRGENAGNIDWLTIVANYFKSKGGSFSLIRSVRDLPDSSSIDIFKNQWIKD